MKLRVKFSKYGTLRFIGHLDVMRYFQKAIRRAHIDIKYSTGFSPHQVMSFASPLGLGIESHAEYMDIEVNSVTDSVSMRDALQAVGVEGLDILSFRMLPDDAGNAMASVAYARYLVQDKSGCEVSLRELTEGIETLISADSFNITKEGKKGPVDFDIRPGIRELSADETGIHMLVDASSAGNIKPSYVLKALWTLTGHTEEAPLIQWQVIREEMYTVKKNEEENAAVELISLEDVGEPF